MAEEVGSNTSITRRKALQAGVAVTGAVWATPVVQILGMTPASAQTGSNGGPTPGCQGRAFDAAGSSTTVLRVPNLPDEVVQTVVIKPQRDTADPNDPGGCVTDASIPNVGTIQNDCVTSPCPYSFTGTNADLSPMGLFDVDADALYVSTNANCAGASHEYTIANLMVGPVGPITIDQNDPNPPPIDLSTFGIPGLTGTVDVVKVTSGTNPNSVEVDLIYIDYTLTVNSPDVIGAELVTTGIVRIGHAESQATNCP